MLQDLLKVNLQLAMLDYKVSLYKVLKLLHLFLQKISLIVHKHYYLYLYSTFSAFTSGFSGICCSIFSISIDISTSDVKLTGCESKRVEAFTSFTLLDNSSFIFSNKSLFSLASCSAASSFSKSIPKSLLETERNSLSLYFSNILIANSSTSSVKYNTSYPASFTISVCGIFSIRAFDSPIA